VVVGNPVELRSHVQSEIVVEVDFMCQDFDIAKHQSGKVLRDFIRS